MDTSIKLIARYFDFNYVLACAVALILFTICYYIMQKEYTSQGQSISKKDILCGLALVIYITIILGGTLLNRTPNAERTIEWFPFWSYRDVFVSRNLALLLQIVYNIVVFIPTGILLPIVYTSMRKASSVVGCVMIFSLAIEIMQLIFKLGLFEFDDIFHNTLGALVGYIAWKMYSRFLRCKNCTLIKIRK